MKTKLAIFDFQTATENTASLPTDTGCPGRRCLSSYDLYTALSAQSDTHAHSSQKTHTMFQHQPILRLLTPTNMTADMIQWRTAVGF